MGNWLGMGPPPGPRSGVLMDITTALNECKSVQCPLNLNKLRLPITNLGFNPKDINIEYYTQLDPETNSNVTYANVSVSDKVIPTKSVGIA